jgi:branched-subunit amino acid transport protein
MLLQNVVLAFLAALIPGFVGAILVYVLAEDREDDMPWGRPFLSAFATTLLVIIAQNYQWEIVTAYSRLWLTLICSLMIACYWLWCDYIHSLLGYGWTEASWFVCYVFGGIGGVLLLPLATKSLLGQ